LNAFAEKKNFEVENSHSFQQLIIRLILEENKPKAQFVVVQIEMYTICGEAVDSC
jgi:hypothetical protein